jgi:hypothetical protein
MGQLLAPDKTEQAEKILPEKIAVPLGLAELHAQLVMLLLLEVTGSR